MKLRLTACVFREAIDSKHDEQAFRLGQEVAAPPNNRFPRDQNHSKTRVVLRGTTKKEIRSEFVFFIWHPYSRVPSSFCQA
jgi:hypothetical protein